MLLSVLLALATSAAAQTRPNEIGFTIQEWGGINSYNDSARIPDSDAQDAENVLTDRGFLEKRPGMVISTSIPSGTISSLGHYGQSTSNRYIIIQSSNTVYRWDGASVLSAIASVNGAQTIDTVAAWSSLYIVDATTGVIQVTPAGSSSTISGSPVCTFIALAYERLWCSNIPTESNSRVRISSFGGAGYWTVPPNVASQADASNSFDFNKDDGESLSCQKVTPWGVVEAKPHSMFIIKGLDNSSFRKEIISPTIGCADQRSMQMHEGRLVWFSADGVYAWTGAGPPVWISQDIDSIIRSISLGSKNSNVWAVDSQTDFESGTLNFSGAGAPVDSKTIPGEIIPSSFTAVDNTTGTFAQSTGGYASTVTASIAASTAMTNSGFENGDFTNWTNAGSAYQIVSNSPLFGGISTAPWMGKNQAYSPTRAALSWNLKVQDGGTSAVLISTSYSVSALNSLAVISSLNLSTFTNATMKLVLDDGAGNSLTSAVFSKIGSIPFAAAADHFITPSGYSIVADFPEPMYVYTSTAVSRCFDTGLSTPTWGTFSATDVHDSSQTINYYTRVATSCSGSFDALVNVTTGSRATSAQKQVIEWEASFITRYSSASASASSISIPAATTAYYLSPVKYLGTGVSSFGNFSVSDGYGGGPATVYQIRAATYTFSQTDATPSWNSQSPNAAISIATGAYAQWRSLWSINSATQAAYIDRVAVNSVSGSAPSAASASYKRRYFFCTAVSTSSSVNDTCFVLQRNQKWTKLTGPNIAAMDVFDSALYGGSATNSKVWKLMQESVYNDDGAAISSFWTSKDFMFAPNGRDWPVGQKVLNELWIDAGQSTGTFLTSKYAVNKSTTYASGILDLGASGFAVDRKVPFKATYGLGKYFRFNFANAQIDHYFGLNAYSVYGEPQPKTQD